MICPRTKGNCGCSHAAFCGLALNQIPTPAPASLGVSVRITADELAAMARDAERYRWLRDFGHSHTLSTSASMPTGVGPYIRIDPPALNRFCSISLSGSNADEVIDAAMAERNK